MAWTFELCRIADDSLIADITSLCLHAKVQARLNRPMMIELQLPADDTLLQAIQADGDPALWVGTRAIKAKRNGTLRGHVIVWTLSYDSGPDYDMRVLATCWDPLIRLNYRTVYDSVGRLADPQFADPITGGALLRQAINNSVTHEDNLGSPLRLPILTTGGADTTTQNLAFILTDAPLTIGELLTQMTDTGVVDVTLTPVDTSMGVAAGYMGRLNTYNVAGTDKSATISFDFDTGLRNVTQARRVIDMTSLGNRLWYYLGPRIDKNRFRSNITGTETGAAPGSQDLSAYQTLQLNSRAKYGTFTEVRVYDADEATEAGRPLYHELWKTEVTLRVNPRDLVYFTPAAAGDNFVQHDPFDDFTVGDVVAVNASANLGRAIASTQQRIYGFDVEVDADGVERVGELICSADQE